MQRLPTGDIRWDGSLLPRGHEVDGDVAMPGHLHLHLHDRRVSPVLGAMGGLCPR